jgi:hypothetical protein
MAGTEMRPIKPFKLKTGHRHPERRVECIFRPEVEGLSSCVDSETACNVLGLFTAVARTELISIRLRLADLAGIHFEAQIHNKIRERAGAKVALQAVAHGDRSCSRFLAA